MCKITFSTVVLMTFCVFVLEYVWLDMNGMLIINYNFNPFDLNRMYIHTTYKSNKENRLKNSIPINRKFIRTNNGTFFFFETKYLYVETIMDCFRLVSSQITSVKAMYYYSGTTIVNNYDPQIMMAPLHRTKSKTC